jgi:hypothetical protein
MKQKEAQIPADQRKYLKNASDQILEMYTKWAKPSELAQWRQKIAQNQMAASRK